MYKEIKISNEQISAVICSLGAEFKSIKKNGRELLWDGAPDVWSGQAPVLFPICGGLKEDKFIYDGKDYTLPKHGFARFSEFKIEKSDETSATFLLCSNAETLRQYPFEFELRVIFTLEGDTIKVDYSVTNLGVNTMYYSIGAHEAYSCPNGIEDYSIIFDQIETLSRTVLDGNLLEYKTIPVIENRRELALKNEYFESDALVFTDIKSRKVTLKNNLTGEYIDVDYDADYLLIWTKPGAKYICIEPWCGLPDFVDSDNDLSHKKGIITLASGKEHTSTHTIKL